MTILCPSTAAPRAAIPATATNPLQRTRSGKRFSLFLGVAFALSLLLLLTAALVHAASSCLLLREVNGGALFSPTAGRLSSGVGAASMLNEAYLDCRTPTRLGSVYGGWSVCAPTEKGAWDGKDVISIGVGSDISWDEGMMSTFHTQHHAFDPTPSALRYLASRKKSLPTSFSHHAFALGVRDGNATFGLPQGNVDSYASQNVEVPLATGQGVVVETRSMKSMMEESGVMWAVVVKMDVEGAEFGVMDAWGREGYSPPADEVLVEFHERYFRKWGNASDLVERAVARMAVLGFEVVFKTKNNMEYTFVRSTAIAERGEGVLHVK